MKKVGIITHYYGSHNIGGLLQSYALCLALNQLGVDAEQICYQPNLPTRESRMLAKKMQLEQALCCSPGQLFGKIMEKLQYRIRRNISNDTACIDLQWKRFKEFEESIPHSKKVYTDDTIAEADAEYDVFLCGSDIVWHPANLAHPAYHLQFADPQKRKASYAASMGRLPKTPIEKRLFSERLSGIQNISVREKSAAEYILQNEHREVEVVVDPTLLLCAEDWEKNEKLDAVPENRYAFCYFLGSNKTSREATVQYCKEKGLQIIYLPYIMNGNRSEDAPLKEFGTGLDCFGPEDVVGLIHHAECIFTDSFHAVVFSTIFGKQFFAFDRDKKGKTYSINSRIDDFLKEYGMEMHHVDVGDSLSGKETAFLQKGNIALEEAIKASYEYLKKVIE